MGKKKGGGGEKKPKAEKEGSFKWYVDERYEGERNATQQYEGRGTYSYTCGGVYTGMWKADQREGHGIYTSADGSLTIAEYRRDVEVEEGVQLSPDRKQAWRRREVWRYDRGHLKKTVSCSLCKICSHGTPERWWSVGSHRATPAALG